VGSFTSLLGWKGVLGRLLTISPYFSRMRSSAKRFKKQIFLSVDVPPEVYSSGQGPAVLLEVEKGVVEQLKGM